MAASGPEIFSGDDAQSFLRDLRAAPSASVGDQISAALRAVAQSETPIGVAVVSRALAALALLLSEYEPEVLGGAADAAEVAAWFAELEIELNPARRQVAVGAINRIVLADENQWLEQWVGSGMQAEALAPVYRLRDLLADSASEE